MLRNQDVKVKFAGSIGSDETGVRLRSELDKIKLEHQLIVVDSELTGQAVSLITPGGNRSIVGLIGRALLLFRTSFELGRILRELVDYFILLVTYKVIMFLSS